MTSCVIPPAMPPTNPPKPVTVPTTPLGKTSAGSVMLAHAAWPNITSVSSVMAMNCVGALGINWQNTSIPHEAISMVVFRALLSLHPRSISQRGISPLNIPPAVSAANGIHASSPTCFKSNPRSSCRYFGVQK